MTLAPPSPPLTFRTTLGGTVSPWQSWRDGGTRALGCLSRNWPQILPCQPCAFLKCAVSQKRASVSLPSVGWQPQGPLTCHRGRLERRERCPEPLVLRPGGEQCCGLRQRIGRAHRATLRGHTGTPSYISDQPDAQMYGLLGTLGRVHLTCCFATCHNLRRPALSLVGTESATSFFLSAKVIVCHRYTKMYSASSHGWISRSLFVHISETNSFKHSDAGKE